MDTLAFIASIVSSVAWPGAIVLVVITFRKPIGRLILSLQRAEIKGTVWEFGPAVRDLESRALPDLLPPMEQPEPPLPDFVEVAEKSPIAAVLISYRDVEQTAAELAERAGLLILSGPKGGAFQGFEALEDAGLISASTGQTIAELRMLRNTAVHAPESSFDLDSTLTYNTVASSVTSSLRQSIADLPEDWDT